MIADYIHLLGYLSLFFCLPPPSKSHHSSFIVSSLAAILDRVILRQFALLPLHPWYYIKSIGVSCPFCTPFPAPYPSCPLHHSIRDNHTRIPSQQSMRARHR
ncbi:hypothetical protein BJ875DRAFT_267068 [Amylocarpus encephaloides]|uniref:Secreted protein n=1 Tax=Amylocarpus encephaloides TaxID=45428 RepID=A0A9P7YLA8_9HELO|nr:hypothetical protein BJ875DRAFT_267068 [Amylocarpus encephaloides]